MGYNRYTLKIIVRVFLIFISLLALAYFLPKPNRLITSIFLILFSLVQVLSLIRFFDSINRDLARFIIELKEKDTSEIYFPAKIEGNFKNLKHSFQQISNEIKKAKLEEISQKQYLNYIIENIKDGLISFDEDGKISVINPSAMKLLNVNNLHSIWDLGKIYDGLPQRFMFAKPGTQELIKIKENNIDSEILFNISEVKIESELIKIITFQDLKRELEVKELNAWKKLMRVLTHEIMNSLTPITTLSSAICRILQKEGTKETVKTIDEENLSDIYKNNEAIEKRSEGLLGFIDSYRQLWKLPEPNFEEVQIISFLKNIKKLFSEEAKNSGIEILMGLFPKDITWMIDKKQVEQVIVNLIRNSFEAFENKPGNKYIAINARLKNDDLFIEVADNGKGIEKEIIEEVFIPFFTTKNHGSGIGLSLSKEIIRKHNAEIYFESNPGIKTIFTMKFKRLPINWQPPLKN